VDLLVVFTKGPQTKAALASARHLAGAGTWALTLQNGLGTGERLGEVFPRERILIGMTNWPADLRGPGHVSSHGAGEVRLWTLAGHEHPFIATVSQALSRAGLACTADAGVVVAIWEKATFNAAMNSIASVTGFDVGGMADDPDIQALVRTVLDECTAVAQASGVPVSRERIDEAVRHAFATHRPHKPSMLQDILAGRATEIESINGAIVEHAQRAGVAAPAVRALLQLVRARERKARS
ncbi:MAG: ketopantoate reductase family protein, partial [Burkholderiales bacterium]|nr:ketopantoate reductase family protein [Burkholderiales bacterium]